MSDRYHSALVIPSKCGSLELRREETPRPGPGQLLVKIEATALNPVDWKILKLGIFVEKYPAIIGYDIAGVVDGVGEGVSTFVKGDKV
jgi:NADPH:quinone reductase-like Zn-dependent oxidoreductase